VGWGPLRDQLLRRANDLIPGRFAIASRIATSGITITPWTPSACPSASEGCALALLEAMLCGRPVIATPVGAAPELIVGPSEWLAAGRHASGSPGRRTAFWNSTPAGRKRSARRAGRPRNAVHPGLRWPRQYEELLMRLCSEKRAQCQIKNGDQTLPDLCRAVESGSLKRTNGEY